MFCMKKIFFIFFSLSIFFISTACKSQNGKNFSDQGMHAETEAAQEKSPGKKDPDASELKRQNEAATKLQSIYRRNKAQAAYSAQVKTKANTLSEEQSHYKKTCNFVYINKEPSQDSQTYVFDQMHKTSFLQFVEKLDLWKKMNQDCLFRLWTDKSLLREDIFLTSKKLLSEKGVRLHDLREIPLIKENPKVLDLDLHFYLRADYARAVVLDHEVRRGFTESFYMDLDIVPMTLSSDVEGIRLFGFGMGSGKLLSNLGEKWKPYENSILYLNKKGFNLHSIYIVEMGRLYLIESPPKDLRSYFIVTRDNWKRAYSFLESAKCLETVKNTMYYLERKYWNSKNEQMIYNFYQQLFAISKVEYELSTGINLCRDSEQFQKLMPIIPNAAKEAR